MTGVPETSSDQVLHGRTAETELARAIRNGPFELAIKLALRDCELSLDRIRHRLAQRGLHVSSSTLSNWQTGRSRPERPESIRALRGLEQILGLSPDSLLRLLGPRRARGRWIGHVPGSVQYDSLFDDHERLGAMLAEVNHADDRRWLALSVYDRVSLDPGHRFRSIEVQQLITALVDGVDSCVAFFHAEDGPVPEITAPDGCRLGRIRTDEEAGITVAEILLDCRLARGDVFLLEYAFRFDPAAPPPAEPADYYYRAFRHPCRQYLQQVRFDAAEVPVRCFSFRASRLGAPHADTRPLSYQRGYPAHLYATDAQPGITGIRWEWN